ncbi:MAG: phenylacetate--CoA ligase family protein [Parcubacteria group bacterium]|nr:phenylacetate--CoA ligase family protein [Parcubacteria group bacterium]
MKIIPKWILKNRFIKSYYLKTLKISERSSSEILKEIQSQNFLRLATHISAHNKFWADRLGSICSIDDLRLIPITDKILYRKNLKYENLSPLRGFTYIRLFTSGTSGIPFVFFVDDLSSFWRYLFATRGNRWAGQKNGDYFIRMMRSGHPDPMYFLRGKSDIFLEWPENHINFLEKLGEKSHFVMYGFIEYIRILKKHLVSTETKLNFRSIIVTGERINETERRELENFFGVPILVSYSSREFGRIAQECAYKNGYHINAERFYVEIVDNCGRPVPDGLVGKIIITDTKNFIMPFLRFDIGDSGYISRETCECGVTLPRLYLRDRNAYHAPFFTNKTSPYMLFGILNRVSRNILRYQIIQRDKLNFNVIIAPMPDFSEEDKIVIKERFKEVLGPEVKISISIDEKDFVIKHGKQQPFVSLIKNSATIK